MANSKLKKILLAIAFILLFIYAVIYNIISAGMYKNKLVVEFIDVKNADSIFIKFPDNKTMLIDAGLKESFPQIQKTLNKYNTKKIDYTFITHQHDDHIGSFYDILRVYDISDVYMPDSPIKNPERTQLENYLNKMNIPINKIGLGDVLTEENDIYIEVLSPVKNEKCHEENDYSAILYLRYKEISFMFMGDATKSMEGYLYKFHPEKIKECNIIKLGHHGSDTSSSFTLLEKTNPEYAIISTGNSEPQRPSEKLKYYLDELNIKYLSTKDCGNITIVSDGKEFEIKTQKNILTKQ